MKDRHPGFEAWHRGGDFECLLGYIPMGGPDVKHGGTNQFGPGPGCGGDHGV